MISLPALDVRKASIRCQASHVVPSSCLYLLQSLRTAFGAEGEGLPWPFVNFERQDQGQTVVQAVWESTQRAAKGPAPARYSLPAQR